MPLLVWPINFPEPHSLMSRYYFTQTIQTASKNLLIIIDDVLDCFKMNAGKLDLEYCGFDLKIVLDEMMQLMMHKAEKKGLEIDYILPSDILISPVLMGDPHRINQVISNLVSNAIKFTDKGSVLLTVTVLGEDVDSQEIEILVR